MSWPVPCACFPTGVRATGTVASRRGTTPAAPRSRPAGGAPPASARSTTTMPADCTSRSPQAPTLLVPTDTFGPMQDDPTRVLEGGSRPSGAPRSGGAPPRGPSRPPGREPEEVYRRRRLVAAGAGGIVLLLLIVVIASAGGGDPEPKNAPSDLGVGGTSTFSPSDRDRTNTTATETETTATPAAPTTPPTGGTGGSTATPAQPAPQGEGGGVGQAPAAPAPTPPQGEGGGAQAPVP